MSRYEILALDLSLTSTGVAHAGGTFRIKPQTKGPERLAEVRDTVTQAIEKYRPTLVVLEGYAFGARGRALFSIGELGGVIRLLLFDLSLPYVEVPPTSLKKFATCKGNAPKDAVIEHAIREFGFQGHGNDEADAWMLYRMACCAQGAEIPGNKMQREAREKALATFYIERQGENPTVWRSHD